MFFFSSFRQVLGPDRECTCQLPIPQGGEEQARVLNRLVKTALTSPKAEVSSRFFGFGFPLLLPLLLIALIPLIPSIIAAIQALIPPPVSYTHLTLPTTPYV